MAVIGKDYRLLWSDAGSMSEIVAKHRITVGSPLYAHPAPVPAVPDDVAWLPTDPDVVARLVDALCNALDAERAENERLRSALEPFASEADMWGDLVPDDHAPLCVEMGHTDGRYYGSAAKYTVGDLRLARAALAQKEGK